MVRERGLHDMNAGPAWQHSPGAQAASSARMQHDEHGAALAQDAASRLAEAEASGKTFELVVVLRGTVHRRPGPGRPLWHVRLPDGHYRVVSADSIVAATPVKE